LTLAIFVALYANDDNSKKGKMHFLWFLPQVCMSVTQEVLNISQYPFRFWFLTHFPIGIFILKAVDGLILEIWTC